MYPENPEGTRAIVVSMNMEYDIYPTLPGLELTTCSVASARPIPLGYRDGQSLFRRLIDNSENSASRTSHSTILRRPNKTFSKFPQKMLNLYF